MSKRAKDFITRIQVEGQKAERDLIHDETYRTAKELAEKIPGGEVDRLMYVRDLAVKAIRGQIDREVFKLFVRLTNSYVELMTVSPRRELTKRNK